MFVSWIWLPKKVEFLASKDGKIFKSIGTLKHSISDNSSESIIKQFELKLKTPIEAKYIKIRAETMENALNGILVVVELVGCFLMK